MKTLVFAVALSLLMTPVFVQAADEATKAAPTWLTSFDKATEAATASGKPILANFTGSDWCPWCVKLKKEVFDTQEFKDWAAANVVLLEVDFPRKIVQTPEVKAANAELRRKYPIPGFPTVLFLKADGTVIVCKTPDGKVSKKSYGYENGGPKVWLPNAQKFVDAAKAE